MGIPLGSSFTRTAAVPLDDSVKVADNTARDALASGIRYEGMIVYSVADGLHYALVGGITNGDWTTIGGGGGASNLVSQLFSGDGSTTGFTLGADPIIEDNTFIFISGVYQQKNTYSIVTTALTFSSAPPIGTNNIEVITTTPMSIGTPSDNTVSTPKIQNDAVTPAKVPVKTYSSVTAAVGEIAYSASSGSYTRAGSLAAQDITNLTITITTKGGAVELWLEPVPSATLFGYFGFIRAGNQMGVIINYLRGSTIIGRTSMEADVGSGDTSVGLYESPSKFRFTDRSVIGAAGTYTYKLQVELTATSGGATFYAQDCILYGKEV